MAKRESYQSKLDRVRAPRVHVKYEVEVGDAKEQKELPFVMGVMADLSGKPNEALPSLRDRKFTEIDADNFDKVLRSCNPRVNYDVVNHLGGEAGTRLNVELNFEKLEDFDPVNVAQQVEPMAKLLELRGKLSDLRANLQGNQKLDSLLQDVLKSSEKQDRLKAELESGEQGGSQ
jgi:type VI secretion system protein ImpB